MILFHNPAAAISPWHHGLREVFGNAMKRGTHETEKRPQEDESHFRSARALRI